MQIHPDGGRQPDAKRMRFEFIGIQENAHRQALHDLDPVPRGVLRGQQREGVAAARGDADQMAVVDHMVPVQVGVHGHRLAGAHALELPLFEVGIDPHIVERHHGEERRARRHALADLHGAFGDHAADRRGEVGAVQGQGGVANGGRRRQDLRMIRDGGAVDLRNGLTQLLARGGDVRPAGGDGVARVRELFGGNGSVSDESTAPPQVIVRGALRLLPLLDLSVQFLALREQAAHLAHGAGQIRFRIGLGDFRVRRIEFQQALAGMHGLGVIHVQGDDRAGNFAGHLHHVAVDVGIVGGLVIAAVEKPVSQVAQAGERDHGAQADQS